MNTKVKSAPTGGASGSLGRQVVTPISSRPTVTQTQMKSIPLPPTPPKPKRNERPLKKQTSTGSLASSKNLEGIKSYKSNSAKQLVRKVPLGAALTVGGKADTNSNSMLIPPSNDSLKNTKTFKSDQKVIETSEILKICQETDSSKVYEIDLHGQDLTSCPDFQQFPKLKILDLSGNHLSAISGLQATKDLKELKLYDNNIAEIDGYKNLRELCSLLLQHNKISKIGLGLACLRNLQTLRLDNNRIAVIEPRELVSCANLTSLDLSGNKLESLSAVSNLPNLQELFASGNCFKKSSDITKCRKLQEVDLSRNLLTDLSGLANLPNLQILDVSSNQLTTLKTLKKLIALEELNVNNNRVSEVGYFSDMFPKLQLLYCMDNKIDKWEDIFLLSKLPDLYEMYMTNNPVNKEDQEIFTYHKKIWKAFPNLEVLDGVHRRVPGSKHDSAPVMRPLSASSIISVRLVDSQMKSVYQEEEMLHKSIHEKLTSLQHFVHNLENSEGFKDTKFIDSSKDLYGSSPLATRPESQISIHSTESDRVKTKELISGSLRSSPESEETSASSRCSSRFRIKQAKAFAAKNFDDDDASDEEEDLSKTAINFKFVST